MSDYVDGILYHHKEWNKDLRERLFKISQYFVLNLRGRLRMDDKTIKGVHTLWLRTPLFAICYSYGLLPCLPNTVGHSFHLGFIPVRWDLNYPRGSSFYRFNRQWTKESGLFDRAKSFESGHLTLEVH